MNKVVKESLKQFQIWHQTISLYRLQVKLKEVYDWDKFVKSILMVYNTSQQNSIKITLYFLIYGRIARLPIEWKVFSKNILLDRVITLIHKLLLFRESAKITIKRA